jgi:hypothetical protein
VSFVSSLPANLPKHGVSLTWDFAEGHEQYVRVTYSLDYAVGADEHVRMLPSVDFATSLDTIAVLLSQLDRASASERLHRITDVRDLSRSVETFFISLLGADKGGGAEPGFGVLVPKYLDLQTGKVTTEPTSQSVFIGIGIIGGCIVVGDVTLCYKKLGDVLDWETLRDLLIALKQIDDRMRVWLDIINEYLSRKP